VWVGGYHLKVQSYGFLTQSKLLLSNIKVFVVFGVLLLVNLCQFVSIGDFIIVVLEIVLFGFVVV
jgi:hypothetical protein